jgi:DNA-binding MarR family transcriptional regulator
VAKPATVHTPNNFPSSDDTIRRALQSELIRRCQKNPKYSLRSYARSLGLDPSTVSQILRGKRGLAQKQRDRLLQQVSWLGEALVQTGAAADSKGPTPEFTPLTLDAFTVIADWHHFALSQLLQLPALDHDPRTLPRQAARALGITVSEVRAALERLERLEIIVLENDRYVVHEGNITTTGNAFTAAAYRKLQKQLLEKSITALEELPIEVRDQTSMTMRMRASRLPEARERLRKFRREFCAEFEADPACDEVYQLCLSYFPLSQFRELSKSSNSPKERTLS